MEISETARGTRLVSVTAPDSRTFVSRRRCETRYPRALIEHVFRVKGAAYVCDEIARDESPAYVEHHFRWDILSYDPPEAFAGKRILDFGSGSGASTMVLARLLPDSAVIEGVELLPDYIELARARAQFYRVEQRVKFHQSPNGASLPEGIGQFDYIIFSAVFEHLLPEERKTVLPLLWSHLAPGGTIFLDQTPYRWFPIEQHTTGIPLLNYLPARIALRIARRFCRRVQPDETWGDLLRRGIRGGSTSEIMTILHRDGCVAELRTPTRQGVTNHIDLWYNLSSETRLPVIKRLMRTTFRLVRAVTGVTAVPTLSLAIKKVR